MLLGVADLASCRHAGNLSWKSQDKPIRLPRLRNHIVLSSPNCEDAGCGTPNGHKLANAYLKLSAGTNEVRLGRLSRKIDPHIFQHLRSATVCTCTAFGVAPRSRPDPGLVWAPSDCIPDPPHSPPKSPFTTVQLPHPCSSMAPGPSSLKPLSQTASVALVYKHLAAYESDVPCSICCMSIGLDHRACSLYPCFFCSTTVVILVHLRDTLSSERIGRPYVNPKHLPNHRRHPARTISTSYQLALSAPSRPLGVPDCS